MTMIGNLIDEMCTIAACPNVTGPYLICNPTGKCIFPSQVCDSVQDCPDDSDEVNCSQYLSDELGLFQ